MRPMTIAVLSLGALAAGPPPSGSFITSAPAPAYRAPRQDQAPAQGGPSGYAAAPVPNQDRFAPTTRASHATTLSPNIFRRKDQYEGEAIDPSSSVQAQQNRKASPGGGFSLSMPLQ